MEELRCKTDMSDNLRSHAMVGIQHASDTVKPEAIELVLIHPEAQVAEEESHNLVMAVVEKSAVPLIVYTLTTAVEVLVISAIKLVEAIEHVLGGVTVDHIEEHNNTHAVCRVDELLQVFRWSVAAAGCEKVVDLIAKTGVVCMLHYSHQLDHVVPKLMDPGQHVPGELFVCGNTLLRGGDTDVSLVHAYAGRLPRTGMLELVPLRRGRVPETSVICR